MRVILSVVFMVQCSVAVLHAQSLLSTIDVIEAAIVRVADTVCATTGGAYPTFALASHPDAEWLLGVILRSRTGTDCMAAIADGAAADVLLSIADASTTYRQTPQDDTVERVITVRVNVLERRSGKPLASPIVVRTDLCTREQAAVAQSVQHHATHAAIPAKPTSFWDDIAQPAIFVLAAATTIILLFTVRSQ